ncbi:MAG TPA: hypothetical protein EYP30_05410 [Archaeoglobaceae archaeon]|nr:hypothetical protein [Archaeoglobaceae archaeon]
MDYWRRIELVYDDETLNHIAKHSVVIEEVKYVLRHSKKIVTRLKENYYAIIGEYYGRCLVIIVEKEKSKLILRTARDCTNGEKRRYKRKYKK